MQGLKLSARTNGLGAGMTKLFMYRTDYSGELVAVL
ncbi:hypothetical protein PADK2_19955 [Pseudomonas aeruginosa DK2]|jgi:hypothetical protein|nr:hypothetical protein PADK2_19955 [Pseudomonas aeruginosa DK2]AGO43225.1 hypothetical protein M062_06225 [Pseudomonas aeruginosa RP73]KFB21692.1 hypothetical protein PGPR2_22115 [Pseudomonas aeruginosa PGPR2]